MNEESQKNATVESRIVKSDNGTILGAVIAFLSQDNNALAISAIVMQPSVTIPEIQFNNEKMVSKFFFSGKNVNESIKNAENYLKDFMAKNYNVAEQNGLVINLSVLHEAQKLTKDDITDEIKNILNEVLWNKIKIAKLDTFGLIKDNFFSILLVTKENLDEFIKNLKLEAAK